MTKAQHKASIRDAKAKAKRDAQRKQSKRERETMRTLSRALRLRFILEGAE